MKSDPIVSEIRKQRKKIEESCNNDFNLIFQQAVEIQNKYQDRLVSKPSHMIKQKQSSSVNL